jgi:hypothetical protein
MNFRFVLGTLCIGVMMMSCKSREFQASDTSSVRELTEERTVKVGKDFVIELQKPFFNTDWAIATIDESTLKIKNKNTIDPPIAEDIGAMPILKFTIGALKAAETTIVFELKKSSSEVVMIKTFKINITSN